jgi:IS30 family transposase
MIFPILGKKKCPLRNKDAATICEALYHMFTTYGVCQTLISDRGSEFTNTLGMVRRASEMTLLTVWFSCLRLSEFDTDDTIGND